MPVIAVGTIPPDSYDFHIVPKRVHGELFGEHLVAGSRANKTFSRGELEYTHESFRWAIVVSNADETHLAVSFITPAESCHALLSQTESLIYANFCRPYTTTTPPPLPSFPNRVRG